MACAESLENIPPRKQAYIKGVMEGKSKRQAALDAGFSESMANHATDKIETRDVRKALTLLIQQRVPPERLAKAIEDGLSATETKFFSHEGIVQDERQVPDWGERRQYAELAAEYGGYAPVKGDQERGGGRVIVLLPDPADPEPEGRTIAEQKPSLVLPEAEESGAPLPEPKQRLPRPG